MEKEREKSLKILINSVESDGQTKEAFKQATINARSNYNITQA